jgi:hypothetical protein
MTDARALRRRVTALAMIPAAAGVFGASVAWASSHDPLAQASSATTSTATPTTPAPTTAAPTPTVSDRQAVIDQRLTELNAQVGSAESRIAELQATLAAQAAQAAQAASAAGAPPSTAGVAAKAPAKAAAKAPAAPAPAAPAPAPAPAAAPAPAPAPPVNVVTKASK